MKDWFTVEKIDEDTYAISEYQHWEETHCYLLCGTKRALLIDTGLGAGVTHAGHPCFAGGLARRNPRDRPQPHRLRKEYIPVCGNYRRLFRDFLAARSPMPGTSREPRVYSM